MRVCQWKDILVNEIGAKGGGDELDANEHVWDTHNRAC